MNRLVHGIFHLLVSIILCTASGRAASADKPAGNQEAVREMIEGYDYFLAEDYDQALAHLRRALELDKKNTYLKTLLAEVYYRKQEFDQVIKLVEPIAEAQDSVDSKVYLLLAYSFQAKGNNGRAIDYYKK
ncbi:MAG TPA: tetratricopeptide repeat protein, partial [Candidatus Glassbacteria bacterium]|nr:tetratricopeptide repeat protein [Candidatus Glassbacteria bacterium]